MGRARTEHHVTRTAMKENKLLPKLGDARRVGDTESRKWPCQEGLEPPAYVLLTHDPNRADEAMAK